MAKEIRIMKGVCVCVCVCVCARVCVEEGGYRVSEENVEVKLNVSWDTINPKALVLGYGISIGNQKKFVPSRRKFREPHKFAT